MATLSEIRQKYPQYSHVSDEDLADAMYNKYYSHADRDEFNKRVGYQPMQQQPLESTGLGGIASDALAKGLSAVYSIPSALMQLPSEAYGATKQIFQQPKRAAENIGAGFGQLGHGVLSAPGNIRDYLVKKQVASESSPSFRLPESVLPKDYNYAEALGVQGDQPGDVLLQGIPASIATTPLANKLLSAGSKLPFTSKNIAQKIQADKSAIKQAYGKNYADLFKEASEKGISSVEKPNINMKTIEGSGMPKYYASLKEFIENPSLENAHWAQSGLGQLKRRLEKVGETTGLTPHQNKAYRAAIKAQEDIQKTMFAKHKLGAQPELAEKYANLSSGYAQDVVPYNAAKGLNDFMQGKLEAKDLVKKLKNNKEFMAVLGKKYPQIKINQLAKGTAGKILAGSILSGLGFEEGKRLLK